MKNEPLKTCFRCGENLPRSEFYKHPMMSDGLLGKCKECAKRDVRENRTKNLTRYREYDQIRTQTPRRKKTMAQALKKTRKKNPEKYRARNKVGNAIRDGKIIKTPCVVCGNPKSEAHHEDYSKPLEVVWLCKKHHTERHGRIPDPPESPDAAERNRFPESGGGTDNPETPDAAETIVEPRAAKPDNRAHPDMPPLDLSDPHFATIFKETP